MMSERKALYSTVVISAIILVLIVFGSVWYYHHLQKDQAAKDYAGSDQRFEDLYSDWMSYSRKWKDGDISSDTVWGMDDLAKEIEKKWPDHVMYVPSAGMNDPHYLVSP